MKTDIHPKYLTAQVSCACGNTFTTRSTRPVIKLEICAACHPFYTGRQKLLDTAGRVERFQKRFAKTGGSMIKRAPKKAVTRTPAPVVKAKVLSTAPSAKPEKKPKKDKAEKK